MFRVGQWINVNGALWQVINIEPDLRPGADPLLDPALVTLRDPEGRVHVTSEFTLSYIASDYQRTDAWFRDSIAV